MSIKKALLVVVATSTTVLLLNGCTGTSQYQLTQAGQQVKFIDIKPATDCQYIGKAEGRRGTFFAGTKTNRELIKDAAADLLNNAASMGGNTIYNAQDATAKYISEVAPTDIIMTGEVYKCPIK
ncbi:uncharacterized protein DUF4156 [Orbus hercynius]|uniref:Uncharacterized protein DUF4156 n=1 Tax=Orbus hercynius TaxID=593135 RepID=A0A495RHZ8_9GAMM|nr:DUF4156 domain-containing protein [Orbus hercynius]RKS87132.1 uncharacterized protein DUF4156 [Orbus hercynius]